VLVWIWKVPFTGSSGGRIMLICIGLGKSLMIQ